MKTKRKSPILTIDCLLLNKQGEVLLLKRGHYPFVGFWVLPGGHVGYGEIVENAVKREALEETGLKAKKMKLFGVYSNPKRDPRYHTVSPVYVISSYSGKLKGSRESSAEQFFPLDKLPKKIGFDHRQIINDFRNGAKDFNPGS